MKQRCRNPNNAGYDSYGARGIDFYEDYSDFQNFYADVLDAPEGMWLDRIDNDRGYFPDNIRWAPPSVQANNRRPPKRKGRHARVPDIRAFTAAMKRAFASGRSREATAP
jgi:hypothetical protein